MCDIFRDEESVIRSVRVTMDPVNNNLFEVVPTKSKRKIATPCPNVYLNPALDLLANEDPMCNNAMEIVPNKKRKRTQSCDIAAFENSALDLGISKAAVNEFLVRELENVKKNVRAVPSGPSCINSEINVDLEESNTTIFMPNVAVIKPNISSKDPKIIETQPELDLSKAIKSFDTADECFIEATSRIEVPEPVYANLTDVLPENRIINDTLQNNVSEAQITSSNTINATPYIDENEDMSVLPEEPNIDNSMVNNCIDISKIDNDIDSGISIIEQKSATLINEGENTPTINTTNIQTNITNQIFVNNTSMNLSFIDRLALDSPNLSNSLVLDDDLNESNIMEIKTITIITKKKRISDKKRNTNPFLDPNLNQNLEANAIEGEENPFLNTNETNLELEYNEEMTNRPIQGPSQPVNPLMPRRLFAHDTNSTISTVNESIDQHEYENIDGYRSESPIYENVGEMCDNFNKQSKILGYDVSHFSAIDIMNLNKTSQGNSSNESSESKRDLKHQFLKASNKLSKKVLKTLKRTFKGDKHNTTTTDPNITLNPYEIPRKLPKEKSTAKDSGIENPALNLDASDIEIEEIDEDDDDDEEHQYETIKTLRNTRLNMNVTPLRERTVDNLDISHNKTNTPGKKVRFDSTLNQEKVITGNSFDHGIQSPGFDAKIDKYHDELENCINERKFLQQNM